MIAMDALVRRRVRHLDFLRHGRVRSVAPSKEWLHFSVHLGDLQIVLNLQVQTSGEGVSGTRTVLVWDGLRWEGSVDELSRAEIVREPFGLRVGSAHATFGDGRYRIRVETDAIRADLRLEPVTMPTATFYLAARSLPIHWVIVPRCAARGTLTTRDGTRVVEDGVAYHDHNWGTFDWGDDFAWQWLYAHASDRGETNGTTTVVASQLTNRARTAVLGRALFVWRGARLVKIFRDDEIRWEPTGRRRDRSLLRIPPALRLVRPGESTELPVGLRIDARSDRDRLVLEGATDRPVQLLVPSERTIALTTLTECAWQGTIVGAIGGVELTHAARGTLEHVGT